MIVSKVYRKDIDEINEIILATLGKDFVIDNYTLNVDIALKARMHSHGPIIGFGSACVGPASILRLEDYYEQKKIYGLLKTTVVHPDYQRQGVGKILFDEKFKQLTELCDKTGVDKILVTAWKSKSGIHAHKILENAGFVAVRETPYFWKDYGCIYCGDKCECSCVVYEKNMI